MWGKNRKECLDAIKEFLKQAKAKDEDVVLDVSTERMFIPTKISLSQWKKLYTDDVLDKCRAINVGYYTPGSFYEDEELKREVLSKVSNPKGIIVIEFNELFDDIKSYFRQ